MSNFKIEISSVIDREKLVAEIWYTEIMVAEITQEKQNLEIEFYSDAKIAFDLNELLVTLETAKRKLMKE